MATYKKVNFALLQLNIVICNQNNITSIITELESSSHLIQHCLATGNVCTDSSFYSNNVIE